MAPTTQIFLFVSYAVLGLAIWLLPPKMFDMASVTSGGIAIVAFFTLVIITQWLAALRRESDKELELDKLQTVAATLRHDVERMRRDMESLQKEKNSEEVLAELKVLQTLLNRVIETGGKVYPEDAEPTTKIVDSAKGDDAAAELIVSDEEAGKPVQKAAPTNEDQLMEIIRNSLSENRVDLYLQPIVGLPSRRKVHYECFSRVRDSQGNIIEPKDYLSLAESGGLVGTLDNLLLFRLIQLVRRLGPRRPDVRFFCNLSPYSLEDKEFFPQFIEFMTANREFARRMVFEIAQEDLSKLEDDVKDMLIGLGRLGFTFSLDKITTLNLDARDLADNYFRWVKVDHETLFEDFSAEDADVLRTSLKRQGIGLISSMNENEADLTRSTDSRLEYAQGYLFGAPRSVHDLRGEL